MAARDDILLNIVLDHKDALRGLDQLATRLGKTDAAFSRFQANAARQRGTKNIDQQINKYDTFSDALSRANTMVGNMSTSIRKASMGITTQNKGIDMLAMKLDAASMMGWKFSMSIMPLRNVMYQTAAATIGLGAALFYLAKAAGEVEGAGIIFKNISKSSSKAEKDVSWLKDLATKVKGPFKDVAESGKLLAMEGYNQELILKPMADMAAGINQEGINIVDATRAFTDAMVGDFRRLKNTFHITKAEIEKFAKGSITAEGQVLNNAQLQAGILAVIAKRYAGQSEAYVKTFSGAMDQMQKKIQFVFADLGKPVIEMFNKIRPHVDRLLKSLSDMAKSGFGKFLIKASIIAMAVSGILTLISGVVTLTLGWIGLTAALMAFSRISNQQTKDMLIMREAQQELTAAAAADIPQIQLHIKLMKEQNALALQLRAMGPDASGTQAYQDIKNRAIAVALLDEQILSSKRLAGAELAINKAREERNFTIDRMRSLKPDIENYEETQADLANQAVEQENNILQLEVARDKILQDIAAVQNITVKNLQEEIAARAQNLALSRQQLLTEEERRRATEYNARSGVAPEDALPNADILLGRGGRPSSGTDLYSPNLGYPPESWINMVDLGNNINAFTEMRNQLNQLSELDILMNTPVKKPWIAPSIKEVGSGSTSSGEWSLEQFGNTGFPIGTNRNYQYINKDTGKYIRRPSNAVQYRGAMPNMRELGIIPGFGTNPLLPYIAAHQRNIQQQQLLGGPGAEGFTRFTQGTDKGLVSMAIASEMATRKLDELTQSILADAAAWDAATRDIRTTQTPTSSIWPEDIRDQLFAGDKQRRFDESRRRRYALPIRDRLRTPEASSLFDPNREMFDRMKEKRSQLGLPTKEWGQAAETVKKLTLAQRALNGVTVPAIALAKWFKISLISLGATLKSASISALKFVAANLAQLAAMALFMAAMWGLSKAWNWHTEKLDRLKESSDKAMISINDLANSLNIFSDAVKKTAEEQNKDINILNDASTGVKTQERFGWGRKMSERLAGAGLVTERSQKQFLSRQLANIFSDPKLTERFNKEFARATLRSRGFNAVGWVDPTNSKEDQALINKAKTTGDYSALEDRLLKMQSSYGITGLMQEAVNADFNETFKVFDAQAAASNKIAEAQFRWLSYHREAIYILGVENDLSQDGIDSFVKSGDKAARFADILRRAYQNIGDIKISADEVLDKVSQFAIVGEDISDIYNEQIGVLNTIYKQWYALTGIIGFSSDLGLKETEDMKAKLAVLEAQYQLQLKLLALTKTTVDYANKSKLDTFLSASGASSLTTAGMMLGTLQESATAKADVAKQLVELSKTQGSEEAKESLKKAAELQKESDENLISAMKLRRESAKEQIHYYDNMMDAYASANQGIQIQNMMSDYHIAQLQEEQRLSQEDFQNQMQILDSQKNITKETYEQLKNNLTLELNEKLMTAEYNKQVALNEKNLRIIGYTIDSVENEISIADLYNARYEQRLSLAQKIYDLEYQKASIEQNSNAAEAARVKFLNETKSAWEKEYNAQRDSANAQMEIEKSLHGQTQSYKSMRAFLPELNRQYTQGLGTMATEAQVLQAQLDIINEQRQVQLDATNLAGKRLDMITQLFDLRILDANSAQNTMVTWKQVEEAAKDMVNAIDAQMQGIEKGTQEWYDLQAQKMQVLSNIIQHESDKIVDYTLKLLGAPQALLDELMSPAMLSSKFGYVGKFMESQIPTDKIMEFGDELDAQQAQRIAPKYSDWVRKGIQDITRDVAGVQMGSAAASSAKNGSYTINVNISDFANFDAYVQKGMQPALDAFTKTLMKNM